MPLVTRNRGDYQKLSRAAGLSLALLDWTKPETRAG
jgi:hypothetical protein